MGKVYCQLFIGKYVLFEREMKSVSGGRNNALFNFIKRWLNIKPVEVENLCPRKKWWTDKGVHLERVSICSNSSSNIHLGPIENIQFIEVSKTYEIF